MVITILSKQRKNISHYFRNNSISYLFFSIKSSRGKRLWKGAENRWKHRKIGPQRKVEIFPGFPRTGTEQNSFTPFPRGIHRIMGKEVSGAR
jgi:hypothetical protein